MAGLGLGNLSDTQEKAIVALLSEPTNARAAAAAGVGERTLYRWLNEYEFARAWSRARRQAYQQASALANRYAPLAVQTLARICNNDKCPPAARVAAAGMLLRVGREAIELDDILERIDDLERSRDNQPRRAIMDADTHDAVAVPPAEAAVPQPVAFTVKAGDADHPVLLPPEKVKRGPKPRKAKKKRRGT